MINQHLQMVTLLGGVATAIAELQDFIAACRDAREARKALAVKLVYQPTFRTLTVTKGFLRRIFLDKKSKIRHFGL
jgi:hypothetical protein